MVYVVVVLETFDAVAAVVAVASEDKKQVAAVAVLGTFDVVAAVVGAVASEGKTQPVVV